MIEPLIKTIEVPCGQAEAFRIFVHEMGSWWPLGKRSMSLKASGKPAKSTEERLDDAKGSSRRPGVVELRHGLIPAARVGVARVRDQAAQGRRA